MLICFPEDLKRGSDPYVSWRDEKLGACLPLKWWRIFKNYNRLLTLVKSLIGDPFFCQEQRPLATLWQHLSPLELYLAAYVALGIPFLLQYWSFTWGKSTDLPDSEPWWEVKPAAGVAVAGVTAVPTTVAGVLTLGTGVLTPGTEMKTPETGFMIGILR